MKTGHCAIKKIPRFKNKGSIVVAKILITNSMLDWAEKKAKKQGDINNSFLHGNGNITGYLGEAIVLKYCFNNNINFRIINNKDCDILINNKRYDVKTKLRTVNYIDENWPASIASTSLHQSPDGYIFCSLCRQQAGIIAGFINHDDFFKKAKFVKCGTFDESNNWISKQSHYSLQYKYLIGMELI